VDLPLPEATVAELNDRFHDAEAQEILRWALDSVERVAIASAFQADGTCLLDMAVAIRPDVPVLFLETGFHFEETLAFKRELTERLGLNVVELRGEHTPQSQAAAFGERLYERDPDRCCRINKVLPFSRALHGYDAWITALRRDSSPSRAGTPIVEQYELEPGRPMVKANPLATWTRRDVWAYLKDRGLPHHPLYDLGYAQVGCAPCTRLVFPGEDERAGRWDGAQKVECGIHERHAETEPRAILTPPAGP
jgi:phosphoadenosine phosphosulfate reductase